MNEDMAIELLRRVLAHEKHGLIGFARNGSAAHLLEDIKQFVASRSAPLNEPVK